MLRNTAAKLLQWGLITRTIKWARDVTGTLFDPPYESSYGIMPC